MKTLWCKYCQEPIQVDIEAVEATCPSCTMRRTNYYEQEAMKKEPNKCPHHPHYKALRFPMSGCKICEKIYNERYDLDGENTT